ncbi:MAG: lytic transglycosylase domain-containing protein [Cyanobacteria bacterium M_surface_10_m2_179]|nr:lytic transglycosylase domain-containing protein [Cyanobacteria bacterium M_surface_10_m2_179]
MPQLRPSATLLIGATCLGSGITLAASRQLLVQLAPPLNPSATTTQLQAARQLSIDPERRRDAALLLSAQPDLGAPQRRLLLQGQGWGHSVLAATALKLAAQSAAASGRPLEAQALWQELLRRFHGAPASADALYALGTSQPQRRRQLLQRFPAHPAALAAAVEAGDSLHLARWGARWPGAEALLLARCKAQAPQLTAPQRQKLAAGLLQLGQSQAALHCLGEQPAGLELQLSLDRSLLRGTAAEQAQAQARLLQLARQHPHSPEAREAAALLADQPEATVLAQLQQLPPALQATPAVQARLALEGRSSWRAVLKRWPQDTASWELQWQLARQALLKRHWPQAAAVLAAIPSRQLPAPLAARQLFWQGYAAEQLGQRQQAQRHWQAVLQAQPLGYYSWRALVRLGSPLAHQASSKPQPQQPDLPWRPLASGNQNLDALWRTGQALEAWEHWRHQQGGRPPQGPEQLLLEGRLRTGIGDDWTGLGQLEQAGLRLPQPGCRRQWQREEQQHPRRFQAELGAAASEAGLDLDLLWGVARQESRFSAAVASPVGAVGLLQLMPDTAAEVAGAPVDRQALENPALNGRLGARYLQNLLSHWQGDPFLSVASYNAGAGAVAGWIRAGAPDPRREPELWAEAIPYPETRLYVKKVLGNRWSYRLLNQSPQPICSSGR